MYELSPLERSLINQYQGGFPIAGRPFARVAARLGSNEQSLIASVRALLDQGWLTRFGPLYNAERLGGGLVLAAMAVPKTAFDGVAAILDAMPEVAHNYRRDHRLNMWFVLATETPEAIKASIAVIEETTGLTVYAFPKEREYFLGLWFELGTGGALRTRSPVSPKPGPQWELDELAQRIVASTQAGLPLTPEPCATLADALDCSTADVVLRMEAMLRSGAIRRIGLVPNHYKLGFRGNGMTVWSVPNHRRDGVGERLGALDCVSHCYARPRHPPDWPYNLFAMVHGRDRQEVLRRVAEITKLLDGQVQGHDVLFSSEILKKTGMRLTG